MSQLTVEDLEKQEREKRKSKWTLAAILFAAYTILSLISSVLLIRLSGIVIIVPIILAIYGGLVTLGLFRLSLTARGSGDTFLPLGLFGVLGGHLYSPIIDGPLVILGAQFVLMMITYVVYFQMWKGSTEEQDIRQAINSVLGKTSYPNEYNVASAAKQAGTMLLVSTILLQIGFFVFKDAELVKKAEPYQQLRDYLDPMVNVAISVTAGNEAPKKVVRNLDDLLSIGLDDEQLKPIAAAACKAKVGTECTPEQADKEKLSVAELKENAYQYRNASSASGSLAVYPIVLSLIFLPGLLIGFFLMQGKTDYSGAGDMYLGLEVGISIFLILAFESQIGAAGLVIPLISLVVSIIGLISVFKVHKGVPDEEQKNVLPTQKAIEKAADAPAFAPEEFEDWTQWKKTSQFVWAVTAFEVICLFLYNPDFFARVSAGLADGMGRHFPGYALFSILLSLGTGAICAVGLGNRWRWVKGFTEMRLALGSGQVFVYLLLGELYISDNIIIILPFFILLGLMAVAYVFLGRTRKSYYQA